MLHSVFLWLDIIGSVERKPDEPVRNLEVGLAHRTGAQARQTTH
jgi:hypothetical protein